MVERDSADNEWGEWWDARVAAIEAVLGPCDDMVGHAAIPFDIVCSLKPLELDDLETTGYWSGKPFPSQEAPADGGPGVIYTGQMDAVLALAHGLTLTDDFAPVENLLLPIFADQ